MRNSQGPQKESVWLRRKEKERQIERKKDSRPEGLQKRNDWDNAKELRLEAEIKEKRARMGKMINYSHIDKRFDKRWLKVDH